MKMEFSAIEETTISLANVFNEQMTTLQSENIEEIPDKKEGLQDNSPNKPRKKRKRGTELTLDD